MLLSSKLLKVFAPVIFGASWLITTPMAIANGTVDEDSLNPRKGLRWAGSGLEFDRVLTIQDALVASPVGKVTISRDGLDSGFLYKDPFFGPSPGRITMVSLWGSKIEGCFVRAIIHNASVVEGNSIRELVPVQIELGVGGQIIKLKPNPNSEALGGIFNYEDGKVRRKYTVTDNTFVVNAKVAALMREAPTQPIKLRVTFTNGSTQIFSLAAGSVANWKDAYSFNPTCRPR
jgi:hypothetical protein